MTTTPTQSLTNTYTINGVQLPSWTLKLLAYDTMYDTLAGRVAGREIQFTCIFTLHQGRFYRLAEQFRHVEVSAISCSEYGSIFRIDQDGGRITSDIYADLIRELMSRYAWYDEHFDLELESPRIVVKEGSVIQLSNPHLTSDELCVVFAAQSCERSCLSKSWGTPRF